MATSTAQVSYRQVLAAALQRHNTTGTYVVSPFGPDHATKWYCTFKMNGQVIGQSAECSSKAEAKEGAAHAALLWMATQGYDVAYAVGSIVTLPGH